MRMVMFLLGGITDLGRVEFHHLLLFTHPFCASVIVP